MLGARPTIPEFYDHYVEKWKDRVFLREKVYGVWTEMTYGKARHEARRIGAGLMSLGMEKGDKVVMFSEGRNMWVLAEMGLLYAGGVNVPLSVTLEELDDIVFKINHSESRYVIVSRNQVHKIRKVRDRIPEIRKVIVMDEDFPVEEGEMPMSYITALGDLYLQRHLDDFNARTRSIRPDDYATISYTSGTLSEPKGVLLTHRNYTANVDQTRKSIVLDPDDVMLIILPLDHCFAHVAGFYLSMACGGSIATVPFGKSPMEMLRNIPSSIKEVRPTVMLVVPALVKNFRKNIEAALKDRGWLFKRFYAFALSLAYGYNKEAWNRGSFWKWWRIPFLILNDRILFKPLRNAAFGGRLKYFIGGAAYLDIELQRFFYTLRVPVYQGYGLSEATPVVSANSSDKYVMGTCGKVVRPLEVKICNGIYGCRTSGRLAAYRRHGLPVGQRPPLHPGLRPLQIPAHRGGRREVLARNHRGDPGQQVALHRGGHHAQQPESLYHRPGRTGQTGPGSLGVQDLSPHRARVRRGEDQDAGKTADGSEHVPYGRQRGGTLPPEMAAGGRLCPSGGLHGTQRDVEHHQQGGPREGGKGLCGQDGVCLHGGRQEHRQRKEPFFSIDYGTALQGFPARPERLRADL